MSIVPERFSSLPRFTLLSWRATSHGYYSFLWVPPRGMPLQETCVAATMHVSIYEILTVLPFSGVSVIIISSNPSNQPVPHNLVECYPVVEKPSLAKRGDTRTLVRTHVNMLYELWKSAGLPCRLEPNPNSARRFQRECQTLLMVFYSVIWSPQVCVC